MIIKLDLRESYGVQNLDVAKKNKIEEITLNKNSFESVMPESPPTKTVSLDHSDNARTEVISTSYKNRYIYSDDFGIFSTKTLYTSKFPSYIGDVLFKSYDISIDTSQPEYSGLSSQIPIDVKFSGSVSGATLSSHTLSTKIQDWSGDGQQYGLQYQELLTKLEELDIVSSFDSISTNGFWGKNDWDYTSNIVNNTYNGGATNAYDEICETIQRGADETRKVDDPFLKLLECFYPKIQYWGKNGDTLNIRVQLPFAVYFFESSNAYQKYKRAFVGSKVTNNFIYEDAKITKYQFDSATILFETSGDISTEDITYYNGARKYNAPDSFLFSDSAYKNVQTVTNGVTATSRKNYYECFADDLHEAYKNGKMRFSLKYPVSGVVDTMGFPVLYSQQAGLIRQIGERYFNEYGDEVVISDTNPISKDVILPEGAMCIITNGDDVVFKNSDDSPKQFYVQNSNLEYNGMAVNAFDLVESSQQIKSNFDSFSWAEIDALAEVDLLDKLFSVGDTKMVYVKNNARVSYLPVRILGFKHDTLSDDTGFAGMTLGMDFVLRSRYALYDEYDSNACWKDSDFRNTYLQNVVALLPDDLVSVVRPVTKRSAISPTNFQTENTSDTFFLLSLSEIVGEQYLIDNFSTYHVCPTEGEQYEYWRTIKDGLIAEDRTKLDYYTRSNNEFVPVQWVSRSVVFHSTMSEFSGVDDNGEISIRFSVPNPPVEGISLAFCVGKTIPDYSGVTLETASWGLISEISRAGVADDVFSIGDEKEIQIDGDTYTATIIGFNHDELALGGGNCGLTFALKEPLPNRYEINQTATNVGGWKESYLRTTTLPAILQTFEQDLQDVIRPVIKTTGGGYGDYTVSRTSDRLWVLSVSEIVGSDPNSLDYVVDGVYAGEGTQYLYWQTIKSADVKADRLNSAGISYNPNDYEYGDAIGVTRSPEYRTNRDGGFVRLAGSGEFVSYSADSNFDVFLCFCV